MPDTTNSFWLGFSTRCIAGAILLPFTVVKTKREAGLTSNISTLQIFRTIYKEQRLPGMLLYKFSSFSGLFRGWIATIARDGPYSGLYLLFYTRLKLFLHVNDSNWQTANCAFGASFLATALTQPADVVRANQQFSLHLNAQIPRTLRIQDYWRGFSLRLLRRACMAVVTWPLYDAIRKNI